MLKKLLLNKNRGNITSLIYGQLFLIICVIWGLFNFRIIMLNTLFRYIDDGLTSSLLGAALINVEEYGKSNQLVIHDNDEYIDTLTEEYAQGWTENEASILLSELNYGSSVKLKAESLEHKRMLNLSSRDFESTSNVSVDEIKSDEYLTKSLDSFAHTMTYNMSNGINSLPSTLSNAGDFSGDSSIIKTRKAGSFFISSYVTSNILVNKMAICNVYRANLAKRHVYASDWMRYNGLEYDNDAIYKHLDDVTDITITWADTSLVDEYSFRSRYMPCKYVVKEQFKPGGSSRSYNLPIDENDGTCTGFKYETEDGGETTDIADAKENSSYGSEYEKYLNDLKWFLVDRHAWESYSNGGGYGTHLIFFTDSETTFQGKVPTDDTERADKIKYSYYYLDANGNYPTSTLYTATKITDASAVITESSGTVQKSPIQAYTILHFDKDSESGTGVFTSAGESHNSTLWTSPVSPKIEVKSASGVAGHTTDKKIIVENTSLYARLLFDVEVFPSYSSMYGNEEIATQRVAVSRLVDIELNTED